MTLFTTIVQVGDVISDEFLPGLLVGLFIGSCIGTLAMALVAAGSGQRFPHPPGEVQRAAGEASPSKQAWEESSPRVDLLLDLHDMDRYADLPVTDGDIEQEMKAPVRARPSE